jgi:hypothetical protein
MAAITILGLSTPSVAISGGTQWTAVLGQYTATVTQFTDLSCWAILQNGGCTVYKVAVGTTIVAQTAADLISTQAGLLMSGSWASAASISSSQNDWAPTGWSTCNYLNASATIVSAAITGLGPALQARKRITNTGTNILYLVHQSSLSSAANRIIVPGGQSFVLGPNQGVDVLYDPASSRWVVQNCPVPLVQTSTPLMLGKNLYAWWRPDIGTALSGSDLIGWTSQGVYSMGATGNAGDRPQLVAGVLNGRAGIQESTLAAVLSGTLPPLAPPWTMIAVLKSNVGTDFQPIASDGVSRTFYVGHVGTNVYNTYQLGGSKSTDVPIGAEYLSTRGIAIRLSSDGTASINGTVTSTTGTAYSWAFASGTSTILTPYATSNTTILLDLFFCSCDSTTFNWSLLAPYMNDIWTLPFN